MWSRKRCANTWVIVMVNLLFPGRHLLNTRFQEEYLAQILGQPTDTLAFRRKRPAPPAGTIDNIVFAITSANQENSRYNPVPFHQRARGIDRFAQSFAANYDIGFNIFGIPEYPPTAEFAQYTLQEIAEQTHNRLTLTPENTVVLCSTPALVRQYEQLGFAVLPAELTRLNPERYAAPTPIQVLRQVVAAGEGWEQNPDIRTSLSAATFGLWKQSPEIVEKMLWLFRDPLLTERGSLTDTRDYETYAAGMSGGPILDIKYGDIKPFIRSGKIVDEGCADGALLTRIACDFPDSDLIGIDITREFIAEGQERQRRGEFGGTYVHFHQRNLGERIFAPDSIDTTICNSTTHEIWSYGKQAPSVQQYLEQKFAQTRNGGRIIIRDVIGPEHGDDTVYLWCTPADGSNEDPLREYRDPKELKQHLDQLSTAARFKRFAHDFLAAQRTSGNREPTTEVSYHEYPFGDRTYFVLPFRTAVEFMSKKDYTDNWQSEVGNEEFAFWDFRDWKMALHRAGFQVLQNYDHPEQGSRVYTNPWIAEHRWKGKVELYRMDGAGLMQMPDPVTNMVLVGEKR